MGRWLFAMICVWPGLVRAAVPSPVPSLVPVVVSGGPDKVAVTIYRNPQRSVDDAIDLEDLQGFAVITETRTVMLPPGPVTIRFEGVASGIVPQSALIFGADVREKNRDSALLSQRGLLDAFTGQRVTLRRTDAASGKVNEETALLRSSADGIVVQTARGIEPIYCSGLNETLLFPGVPRTLSPRPVLSMTTTDQRGGLRTITLVYLSGQFDWQANYVGQFNEDATTLDLFAWLTMASNDETSFINAHAAAVAGRVNRVDGAAESSAPDTAIDYNCATAIAPPPAPAPPPVVMAAKTMMRFESIAMADSSDIIVTSARKAVREDLGDLKLYVIPMPVTVAARAQKQVAFLVQPRVRGRMIYRARAADFDEAIALLFRFRNDAASGLGEALPAGKVALFQAAVGQRMLVGEASIADKTVDEDVDLNFGTARNVTLEDDDSAARNGRKWQGHRLKISNANPHPINFEAEFSTADDQSYSHFSTKLAQRPGKAVWAVTVPANGTATLSYRATDRD
jgi:hypothetical protein